MNRKSRLLISVIAVLCVVCILFVACSKQGKEPKKEYSETFESVVSESSYADAESAAEAYLSNEINSSDNKATFLSYKKDNVLSQDRIALLNLPEDGTILSVEKGTVNYIVESKIASSNNKGEGATVYIAEIQPNNSNNLEYKYIVSLPENGETLSKSYYNSVYDSSKYKNCTSKIKASSAVSYGGSLVNVKMDATCYITENGIYMKTTTKVLGQSVNADMYLWNDGDEMVGVMVSNGQVQYLSTADIKNQYDMDSLQEFYTQGITEFDFSYYTKTETGFSLKENVIVELIDKALNTSGMKMYDPKAICNFNISDGHIDNLIISYTGKTFVDKSYVNVSFEISAEYTDFGKTKVSIPNEYKQHFENN